MPTIRRLRALGLAALLLAASRPATAQDLSADRKGALDRISADSLRGHLSFLASDLLEGRATPSRGLDLAAAYIAAQYRRAGLEPIGDDGYFQTANWQVSEPDAASFNLELRIAGETYRVAADAVTLAAPGKLDMQGLSLIKITSADEVAQLRADQVEGKAVLIDVPGTRRTSREAKAAASARSVIIAGLRAKKAALVVAVDREGTRGLGLGESRLIDPEGGRVGGFGFRPSGPPSLTIHDPRTIARLDALTGPVETNLSIHLGDRVTRPVKLKNVAGLLRGSDAALKDTYILVTAHYDHLGIGASINGDTIYNGANDDGSGTVSVVEVAAALATLKERPKRSVLFVCFFGEEHGLLGSRYYGKHPLVPVAKTVADVNLEQVGRTDDTEGPRVAGASLTGFDYSDVGKVFAAAGEAEGVKVEKHPRNSDTFFGRSDNQALADLGVPAHTLCVAFMFADYHALADHWDKIDYANMAKIDRVVARAVLSIADNPEPPKWNADNPRARRYLKASEALHAQPAAAAR